MWISSQPHKMVKRTQLYLTMQEFGILGQLIRLVKITTENTRRKVKIEFSEQFRIGEVMAKTCSLKITF